MGVEQVPTFCPLCVSRCGARAIVADGAFVALAPDPSHPTGAALRQQPSDPVSGSSPLRASVCDVAAALPDPD